MSAALKAYSVTASPLVTRLRGGQGTRRRGGIVFATRPVVVATAAGPGIAEVVSTAVLEAILADPYLTKTEVVVELPPPPAKGEEAAPPKVVSKAEASRRARAKKKA